jgi:hypothetical protein
LRIFENVREIFGYFGNITKILRNSNGLLRMTKEYTGVLGFFRNIWIFSEYLDYSVAARPSINPSSKHLFQSKFFVFGATISPAQDLATNNGQNFFPKLHFGEFII